MADEIEEPGKPRRRKKTRARRRAPRSAYVTGRSDEKAEDADEATPETGAEGEGPRDEAAVDSEAAAEDAGGALPTPPAGLSGDELVAHWRELVLQDPENVPARRQLARALESEGESLLAVEQLEAARAARPDDVDLIVELAQAQTALKRLDAAERELRRGLKLQPENAEVHLALGVISFRRGLYTQAEQELKRALELDPESGSAYFYRGEALNQLSRLDEALDMLERATQRQPANARAYYVMGIVYDKKGRPHEAGAMYRRAREAGAA